MTEVPFEFDFGPPTWGFFGESSSEADAVFTANWDGEEVEVAVRWQEAFGKYSFLIFRRVESPEIYVVVDAEGSYIDLSWFGLGYHPHGTPSSSEKAHKVVCEALKSRSKYGRFHPLSLHTRDFAKPRWLFLLEDRTRGAWKEDWIDVTPFRVGSEDDLTLEAIRNPETPIGFALQWSQLTDDEQLRRSVVFENGNWKQLEQLVRAVTILDPAFHANEMNAQFGDAGFGLGSHVLSGSSGFSVGSRNLPRQRWEMPGVRYRRWANYINGYFAPHRNEQLAAEHLCVAEQALSPLLEWQLTTPTQHERLEAALTLRAWAKGKIPAREARLLLPKL